MGVGAELRVPQMSGARSWDYPDASSHVPDLHVAGPAANRAGPSQRTSFPQGTAGAPLGHPGRGTALVPNAPQYDQAATLGASTVPGPPPASLAGFSTIGTEDSLGLLPLQKVRYAHESFSGAPAAFLPKRPEAFPAGSTVPALEHCSAQGQGAADSDAESDSDSDSDSAWTQHVPISATSPAPGVGPKRPGVGSMGGLVGGIPMVAVHREYHPPLFPDITKDPEQDPGLLDLERRLEMVTLGPENAVLSRGREGGGAREPWEEVELKALENKLQLITAQRHVSAIKCEMFLDYLEHQQRKLAQAQAQVRLRTPSPCLPPLGAPPALLCQSQCGTQSQAASSSDSSSDNPARPAAEGAGSGPLNPTLEGDLGYYRERPKAKSVRGHRTPPMWRKSSAWLSPLHPQYAPGAMGLDHSAHLGHTVGSHRERSRQHQGRKSFSGASPLHPADSQSHRGHTNPDSLWFSSPSATLPNRRGAWQGQAAEGASVSVPDRWPKPMHRGIRYRHTGSPARVFGGSGLRSFRQEHISLDQHCPEQVLWDDDVGVDAACTLSLGHADRGLSGSGRGELAEAKAEDVQEHDEPYLEKTITASLLEEKFRADWEKQRTDLFEENEVLFGMGDKAGESRGFVKLGTNFSIQHQRQQRTRPAHMPTHDYHPQVRDEFTLGQLVPQLLVS